MANQEHVDILKQGVDVWNKWREEHEDIIPNLNNADLSRAGLISADLSGARLIGASLISARLTGANLSDARLTGASLISTELTGAGLHNADLSGASLISADLTDANFSRASLGRTIFMYNNLSKVQNLEKCEHEGPSILHSSTLQASGELPIEFLRGCGLSDWEIESAKLHKPNLSNEEINNIIYKIFDIRSTQAIQISPIFISYSHPDSAFVDKIEKQLTDKGIRYWRDIHHATAGRLEKQVDRAMQLHPIVLLVLSEKSTSSDWVELEVNNARELEQKMDRDVLCPIALDDSWKDCKWPKKLRLQIEKYNILDFKDWENDSSFDKKFTKLLQGLDLFYK